MLDTIVYDVDGVLPDWFPGPTRSDVERLVEDFNRREEFSRLPDIPGAATAVRQLGGHL